MRLLIVVMAVMAATHVSAAETIARELKLNPEVGVFFPLQGALRPTDAELEEARRLREEAAAASDFESDGDPEPFDAIPAGFVVRLLDGHFTLIFHNASKQVVEVPESVLRASLIAIGLSAGRDRMTLSLERDGSGLFMTSPRFVPPPFRYQLKPVFVTRIPNPDELERLQGKPWAESIEAYDFQVLNQIGSEEAALTGSVQ